jgi:hypothetical protein
MGRPGHTGMLGIAWATVTGSCTQSQLALLQRLRVAATASGLDCDAISTFPRHDVAH